MVIWLDLVEVLATSSANVYIYSMNYIMSKKKVVIFKRWIFEELHFSFVFILSHLTIFQLLVLTAIAGINEAVENEDPAQLIEKLTDENAAMTAVDDSLCNRYLSHLMSVKEEKAQVSELASVIEQFLFTGMNQGFHQVLK